VEQNRNKKWNKTETNKLKCLRTGPVRCASLVCCVKSKLERSRIAYYYSYPGARTRYERAGVPCHKERFVVRFHQKTGYWRPGIALLKTDATITHTQLPASRGRIRYIQPRSTILALPCHRRRTRATHRQRHQAPLNIPKAYVQALAPISLRGARGRCKARGSETCARGAR
jgi:hypothetical protein